MQIYLVEDDENIRELVIYTLNANGYEAVGFSNAEDFWEQNRKEVPDLVLLDIMLPGEDGISILKKLRREKETQNIPIMMLTAKGSEYDKIIGLDSGADDYLTKPFGMMELNSRVKALLRRSNRVNKEDEKEILTIANISIDLRKFSVAVDEEQVVLTLREFELLKYLLENKNMVVTRTQLLTEIWGYDYEGETRTVDVHIGSLRQKLGSGGKVIETIRGVGYKIQE